MEKHLAILMADLNGYTALTEVHGSKAAADIVNQFEQSATASLHGESFIFKRIGDQIIIMSSNADDLSKTVLKLRNTTREIPNFPGFHAGLHYGSVLQLDGDYYGSSINIAARITAKATGGKILSSIHFIDALSDPQLYASKYFGQIRFKNVLEKIEIVELISDEQCSMVDPVCRMRLDHVDIKHIMRHDDGTFYFCSELCFNVFKTNKNEWLIRESFIDESSILTI